MNALMTASMGGAFRATGHHHRFYHAIAWTGAAYSCIIGLIFLFGISGRLPQFGVSLARTKRGGSEKFAGLHGSTAPAAERQAQRAIAIEWNTLTPQ